MRQFRMLVHPYFGVGFYARRGMAVVSHAVSRRANRSEGIADTIVQ